MNHVRLTNKLHPDNDWGGTHESVDAWFAKRFEGVTASDAAKRAAKRICMSYGIRGLADPGYIANVIEAERAEK